MIAEFGTVVELKDPQLAIVLCQRNSACDHCPSSSACKMGDDKETMQVEARNPVGAVVGDQVKLVTSSKHFLQSSFILYIIPIIGLLIGALTGQSIGEASDNRIDPSLLSAIFSVVFLVGTLLSIRLATRRMKRELFMPRIVEIQQRASEQTEV